MTSLSGTCHGGRHLGCHVIGRRHLGSRDRGQSPKWVCPLFSNTQGDRMHTCSIPIGWFDIARFWLADSTWLNSDWLIHIRGRMCCHDYRAHAYGGACVAMATGPMHSAQYVLDLHVRIGPPYAFALLHTHICMPILMHVLPFYTWLPIPLKHVRIGRMACMHRVGKCISIQLLPVLHYL